MIVVNVNVAITQSYADYIAEFRGGIRMESVEAS